MKNLTLNRARTLFTSLLLGLTATGQAAQPSVNFGNLPLWFEADRNQAGVQYIARTENSQFVVTPTGATFALRQPGGQTATCTMQFVHGNPVAPISGGHELDGKINRLVGNDQTQWQTGIATFGQVRVDEVYPGINVVYYGNGRQLEYDFNLAAEVDPGTIAIHFDGAEKIAVNDHGELVVSLPGGEVRQHQPVIYQLAGTVRHEISGGYKLRDAQTVTFQVGDYDHSQPLVIDPILSFSTYFGGNGAERSRAIAVDNSGNIYIAGQTLSSTFANVPTGAQTGSFKGGSGTGDAFVAKLNPTNANSLIFLTYIGGRIDDFATAIAVDTNHNNNVYITGGTDSPDFPNTNAIFGQIRSKYVSSGDFYYGEAFVAVLTNNGSAFVYSTYLGGYGQDAGQAIAIDAVGNAYVAGYTSSTNFPVTNSWPPYVAMQTNMLCTNSIYFNANVFLAEIAAGGTALKYSSYFGGHNYEEATGIALDNANNIYVTGFTDSTNFPVTNAISKYLNGSTNTTPSFDAFVAKFQPGFTGVIYSTFIGGSGADQANAIALDGVGNTYIVGQTYSTNYPTTNALQTVLNGTGSTAVSDAFITKLTPAGQLVYSSYLGGSLTDLATGVKVQSDGEAVIVGQMGSTNFAPSGNYGAFYAGMGDVFVAKLSSDGRILVNFAFLGGGQSDIPYGVALDSLNFVYVTGYTVSANFPTANAWQTQLYGSSDAFITKLFFEPSQLGTTVYTTWQNATAGLVLAPPATLAASSLWSGANQIASISSNGVTSLVNNRFQRGASYDPTFTSFIIPLSQQTGFRLNDSGDNSANFNGSWPWFTRLQNDTRTHLSLVVSTNIAGISTNYYGYVTNFNNPIAAFGANAGGSTLYVNQQVKYGVYCGAQYETTNSNGTNFAAPLRILVYNLASFVSGQTNLVAPIATNYIAIPRRTIAADATNWLIFSTNGFAQTIEANGLRTTVQLVTESGGAWGVVPQFTNAQSGTYVVTHECTTNLGYGYVLEGIGVVPLATNLYPMVTNSTGAVGWDRLYTMDFQSRSPWRSVFIDQPQFNGTPMPSFYQGASLAELLALNAVVTNAIPLTDGVYATVDNSPELRRHPLLDQLVANLNNDPVALANYVVNQVELTDALAYNENNGQASAATVSEGGVNRSALGVYLEGQGSPVEHCALLVYLLRQAGYPAAYAFPTNNNVQMLDTRLSALLRMQLHGAVNQFGQPYTTNTLITVNYPWVVTTISNQTVHIFPWLKDTQITEGLNLYDYMPTNYDNGFKWLSRYLYGDTNILNLSLESDAPSILFPRFIKQQLLTNAPGISLDDIGLRAFNRQHYYARWQDFPTPTVVNNPAQIVCADNLTSITNLLPGMTGLFNTVTLTLFSLNNTNTQLTVGPLQMADLHNREMFMTTNGANSLMLWLAPYLPGVTNQSAFDATDPALTNQQVATLTFGTNDFNFAIRMTHQRHQAINFSPANQFLGVSETLQFSTPNRPFNLTDITAICFNVGRVTPAMIDVHAQAFQQMAYQWSLNTNTIPAVADYQGAAAYMMGMDYYSHVSQFLPVCAQLHKAQVVSWYAEGLSRLSPVLLGAQNFMRPSMDMFYSEMAHAGNGTSHPDSGNDTLAATDDFAAIMAGEIAAQEHSIINGYYQAQNSVSAVVLLRLAQQRATNGVSGIIELNRNNYQAVGATNAPGGGPTALQNYDTVIWAAVTNAFQGWDADYVRAYITPGPVSMSVASYRGMGLVIVGKSQSASLISVNMNGVLGANSLYFADTPAALSSTYSASPAAEFSTSLDAGSSYGSYYPGGNLYYGGSPSGSSSFDYYWTTPSWSYSPFASWSYVQSVSSGYQFAVAATPPSQVDLSRQINDLYNFPQSTPLTTSLSRALDSGNTGSPIWHNLKNFVYDPVNVMSGEFYHDTVDLTLAGPLPFQLRRNYSSQNQDDRNGFGYGWNINVVPYLGVATSGTTNILTAVELDGSVIAYRQQTGDTNLYLPTLTDNRQLDNFGNGHIGSIYNPFNAKIVHSFSGTNELYTLTAADGQTRCYTVNSFPVSTTTGTVSRQRPYLTRWQDTQGNSWTFTYGTKATLPNYGSVIRIQCSNGNYLGLDYNAGGYVIAANTSGNERTSYQYDDFGDLVRVVRADDTEETYEYQHKQWTTNSTVYVDSTHLLIKEFKPDGRVLQNSYDSQRRVTNQLATVGTDLKLYTNAVFIYSNNFSLSKMSNGISGYTLVKDVNGNTNRYDYVNSLVTTNTDPLGQKVIQIWYADNATVPGYARSLYQTRDQRGLWTQFQYDSNGNATNSLSWGDLIGDGTTRYATNTASYNGNNLPVKLTDPVGNSVQTVYHPQYPYLPQFVVYAAGSVATVTNQFDYGNVTNIGVNGSLTFTNMAFGLLQQQIRAANSPDAAISQWAFDGRGYLTQQTQFTGTGDPAVINYFTCNDRGEVIEREDAAGQVTYFEFDAMHRPIVHEVYAANQALPLFWEYAYYNDNGELTWYDGPRYNPEDYQWRDYDGAGRLITELRWRAEAKPDGSGLTAPAGYNLYAQSFYQYDKFGNLTLAVDPRGAMTTNKWDALGRLTQQQHLDVNGTTRLSSEGFAYEPGGLVQYYTNGLGGVTTTLYTTNGLPKYRSYPDGSTNAWRYGLDGRISKETQGNGAYWQTTYDDVNRVTTRVFYSATGTALATNSTQLDRRGNVIRRVDAANNAFTTVFDGLDRIKIAAGPAITNVIATTSGAIPGGPLTYTTNVLQQVVTNFYDAAGQVLNSVNALGETSVTRFDALGRVTQTQLFSATGTLIRQSSLGYSADFSRVTVTNGVGADAIVSTTYTDNDGQNVLAIANPASGVTEFALNQFDLTGNLVAAKHNSLAGGNLTNWTTASFAYDGLNRLTQKFDRDNAGTTNSFDALNNLTNLALPGGLQWRAVFNNAGQMLRDWNLSGTSATRSNNYAYFASGSPFAGLLQTKIDGRNTTNTFTYDDWLRVTSLASSGTLPEQKLTTAWQYEPRGYVTTITEQFASTNTGPNTSVIRSFDAYGQLTAESVIGGSFAYGTIQGWDAAGRRNQLTLGTANYGFAWQADGALVYASNPTGSGSYTYNTAGLLNTRLVGSRYTSITSRDGMGRPLGITTSVNLVPQLAESLTWSGDGLLATHTLVRNNDFTDSRSYAYAPLSRRLTQEQLNLNSSARWTNNLTFDNGVAAGPGVLTKMGQASGASNLWNGATDAFLRVKTETNSTFQYAAYGHVNGQATLSAWLDNSPVSITGIGTNAMQWRAAMELTPGTHQLKVAATHPSGFYTALTTNSFTNNLAYQFSTNVFDGAGNITLRIWRNPNGTTNRTQTLAWDARGRLLKVTERESNTNGQDFSVVYDGLGRKLQTKQIIVTNGVAFSSQPVVVSHYFDPLGEFLELGVNQGSLTTWKLMGPDLDGNYGGQNGTGGFDGSSPYLNLFNPTIADFNGNILGTVTNNAVSWNGSRIAAYGAVPNYRPPTLGSSGSLPSQYAYRNRATESIGLICLGANWYDPIDGKFMSPDPLGHAANTTLYEISGGNPLGYFDADGRLGKGPADAANTALQGIGSFFKNSYFSMSYGLSVLTYGSAKADQWYGQNWQGFKNTITGTAQTAYDIGAFGSYALVSPFDNDLAYQSYSSSMQRLGQVGDGFRGDASKSSVYQASFVAFNLASLLVGGEFGQLGRAGALESAVARNAVVESRLFAGKQVGWANPIPLYNVNAPWYQYVVPRFDVEAGVVTEGRTTAQIAGTKAHEGQHIMDILSHPQITHLASRQTYFPGSGLSRYWMEYRGYRAGGSIAGIGDLTVPLGSFKPYQLKFLYTDIGVSAGLGFATGYGIYNIIGLTQ